MAAPVRWATSGAVKIERANEHIGNLEAEIAAFLKSNPYAAVGYDDEQTGDWVVVAKVRELPPLRWGAVAGDAIHNLRSSLDVLYGIAVEPSNQKSMFPFFPSAHEYKARFRRIEKAKNNGVLKLVEAAKTYPGGNDVLYLLHLLSNEDKHRRLVPAYGRIGTTVLDFGIGFREMMPDMEFPSMKIGLNWADPACPVEDGTELFRDRSGTRSKMHTNPEFPLEIAFGEVPFAKGKAIIPTLHQLRQAVEGVVEAFESAGFL